MAYPSVSLSEAIPSDDEILQAENHGYREYYLDQVHAVASMKMYDNFSKSGWATIPLSLQTNHELTPIIIKSVMLAGWRLFGNLEAEKKYRLSLVNSATIHKNSARLNDILWASEYVRLYP